MAEPIVERVAGLTLRARRHGDVPLVSVRVLSPGGSRRETIPGLALVSGRGLLEGSRQRSWRRIAEEAEDRGACVAASGTLEGTYLAIDALADDWERILGWVAELALEPSFPEDRVRWVAEQAEAELTALAEQGEVVTGWSLVRQLYHPHPWGRPLHGTVAALRGITSADCAAFWRASLSRGLVVAVAGRVDPDRVRRRAEELFSLPPPGRSEPRPALPASDARREEIELLPGEQAHLALGRLTVDRCHPDLPALSLLAVVLGAGAGLVGRIPTRVREREGLAYAADVDTTAGAGTDSGRFQVRVATSPATVERAIGCVREEIERLLLDGISADELTAAKSYLSGRLPFQRETAAQWARTLVEGAFYGLPLDRPEWLEARIEGVDLARVNAVARRYLDPETLAISVGRPAVPQ